MKANSESTLRETKERFGYQWTRFAYMTPEFEQHFLQLVAPITASEFSNKTVLDAGCGYGRYALYAAKFGGRVTGMDFSEAIVAAQEVTQPAGIGLVRGNILQPPFASQFDIVMSIGVLHHLPDPQQGFKELAKCVKPGGRIVIWVYSARRQLSNAIVEGARGLARFLPHRALHAFTFLLAVPDFCLSKLFRLVLGENRSKRIVPTHFQLYAQFPFRVCWADWFDRLGAPVRHYYTQPQLEEWLHSIGARGVVVSTQDFGWTVIGQMEC